MNNYLDCLTVYEYNNKKRLGICSDGGYVIGLLDEKIIIMIAMYLRVYQQKSHFLGIL